MNRREAYALLAFGVGALCLSLAARLVQKSRERTPARLADKMESRLGDLRRRTTAFDAKTLVS